MLDSPAESNTYCDAQGRLKKPFASWTSTYMEGPEEKYLTVTAFTEVADGVRSSAGLDLRKGESTALTLRKPDQSWRVMANCWGPPCPVKSVLRQRLESGNAWLTATFGLPLLFKDRHFYHLQITTPALPAGREEGFLDRPMEFHRI